MCWIGYHRRGGSVSRTYAIVHRVRQVSTIYSRIVYRICWRLSTAQVVHVVRLGIIRHCAGHTVKSSISVRIFGRCFSDLISV